MSASLHGASAAHARSVSERVFPRGARTRDVLTIGQRWRRRRDRVEGDVRQVHRADRVADVMVDGELLCVEFGELRRKWVLVRDVEGRA